MVNKLTSIIGIRVILLNLEIIDGCVGWFGSGSCISAQAVIDRLTYLAGYQRGEHHLAGKR